MDRTPSDRNWRVRRGMVSSVVAAVLLAAAGSADGADGDRLWGWDGQPIAATAGDEDVYAHAPDGAGGTLATWQDDSGGGSFIYVRRFDANGTPAWASPVQLSTPGAVVLIGDIAHLGGGESIVVWREQVSGKWVVYAMGLSPTGVKLWAGPVALTNTSLSISGTLLAAPSNAGAFVIGDDGMTIRAMHVVTGGIVSTPGINGLVVGTRTGFGGGPVLAADQAGLAAAYVVWADTTRALRAQRLHIGAGLTALWATPIHAGITMGDTYHPSAAYNSAGQLLIGWTEIDLWTSATRLRVQKTDTNGSLLWGTAGTVLVDSSIVGGSWTAWQAGYTGSAVAPDATGGAYVAWNDWRNEPGGTANDDIFAQRVDSGGTAQWAANGISVDSFTPGSQRYVRIISDGVGGAYLVYQDLGGWSWDISGVRLNPGGKMWDKIVFMDGYSTSDPGDNQVDPEIVFDGAGSPAGAVVLWVDDGQDIYGQRVALSATNTPAGSGVSVTQGDVTLTFASVAVPGQTVVTKGTSGTPLNMISFAHACSPPQYYVVTTTAGYTGPVDVEIYYDEGICNELFLHLLYYDGVKWSHVTTDLDQENNVIYGQAPAVGEFCLVVNRYLPEFCYLNGIDITGLDGLLSDTPIDGSDGLEFWPETYFLYVTEAGRYGKFIVEELAPALNHQLKIAWETYNADGSIYSYGSDLVVAGSFLVDMDAGVAGGAGGNDWHWNQVTGTQRYLDPWMMGARFKLMYRAHPPSFAAINPPYIAAHTSQMNQDWMIGAIQGGFCFNTYWVYRTTQGRLGKAGVLAFFNTPDLFYTLVLGWETYNSDGSVRSSGLELILPNNWGFEADSGVAVVYPPDADTDFWWLVDEPGGLGGLVPLNTATAKRLNHSHSLWPGDCTCDGIVDLRDVAPVAAAYGNNACDLPEWCFGADFNHDGVVDMLDVAEQAAQWLHAAGP